MYKICTRDVTKGYGTVSNVAVTRLGAGGARAARLGLPASVRRVEVMNAILDQDVGTFHHSLTLLHLHHVLEALAYLGSAFQFILAVGVRHARRQRRIGFGGVKSFARPPRLGGHGAVGGDVVPGDLAARLVAA